MSLIILRAGYDFTELFQLYLQGAAEDLSAATIKASVKNFAKTVELILDTAQANSGTGVSWLTGRVAIVFPKSATTGLAAQAAWIELAVTKGGLLLPYRDIPIVIELGYTLS